MGEVRIASGRFRGRKIKTPSEETTRPLLTRLRKSLADVMRPQIAGSRILDLFGGSGAIVLELISNGADSAVIVELDKRAADLISSNVFSLNLQKEIELLNMDAVDSIASFSLKGKTFDIIVIAPPYGLSLQQKAFDVLSDHNILSPQGVIIVQRDKKEPPCDVPEGFVFTRTRNYGRTIFDFYSRNS
jgi:16S rRNA (guanine(966)-N(2))-methyltransferase RsmD